MWIPDFILKMFGREIASKLNLQEGVMPTTKSWYLSKGVWTGVVTALMGLYLALAPQFNLPHVPDWIFTILGAAGVYARSTATTTLTS